MPWSIAIWATRSTAYSLPKPPKSSAMPGSGRNTLPGARWTFFQPTSARAAATSASVGTRGDSAL